MKMPSGSEWMYVIVFVGCVIAFLAMTIAPFFWGY